MWCPSICSQALLLTPCRSRNPIAPIARLPSGGAIDIRTKRIPNGFVGGLQLGSAFNDANDDEVLTYAGGGEDNEGQDDGTRALSPRLQDALIQYQGNVSVQNILSRLRGTTQPNATLADAQAINRQFGSYLYRDLSVLEKDTPFDRNIRGYLGNSVFVTDDFELGALAAEAIPTNGERRLVSIAASPSRRSARMSG